MSTDTAITQLNILGYDVTTDGNDFKITERTTDPRGIIFEVHGDNDLIHMATVLQRWTPHFAPRDPKYALLSMLA